MHELNKFLTFLNEDSKKFVTCIQVQGKENCKLPTCDPHCTGDSDLTSMTIQMKILKLDALDALKIALTKYNEYLKCPIDRTANAEASEDSFVNIMYSFCSIYAL